MFLFALLVIVSHIIRIRVFLILNLPQNCVVTPLVHNISIVIILRSLVDYLINRLLLLKTLGIIYIWIWINILLVFIPRRVRSFLIICFQLVKYKARNLFLIFPLVVILSLILLLLIIFSIVWVDEVSNVIIKSRLEVLSILFIWVCELCPPDPFGVNANVVQIKDLEFVLIGLTIIKINHDCLYHRIKYLKTKRNLSLRVWNKLIWSWNISDVNISVLIFISSKKLNHFKYL